MAQRVRAGVRQYAIRATTTFLDGRLAHMTKLDVCYIAWDVLEASEIEVEHKQLLMRVLMTMHYRILDELFSVIAIAVDWRRNYQILFG